MSTQPVKVLVDVDVLEALLDGFAVDEGIVSSSNMRTVSAARDGLWKQIEDAQRAP